MGAANEQHALREGISAARAGNTEMARGLLLRAAEIQPQNEQAWFWLAYIAEDPEDRLSYLRKILNINPGQKQAQSVLKKALLQAGISAARAGDKVQARMSLLEILDIDPTNEQAWLWLASVSTTYREVRHCLQRVLEINPSNQRAASWLSAHREQTASATPAWTCPLCGLASAVKASRCSRCKAVLTLGNVTQILQNHEADRDLVSDAVDRYKKVAETNSTFGLHYTLGLGYLNLQQPGSAMAHLRKALDLQPSNRLLRSQIEALERNIPSMPKQVDNAVLDHAPANGTNSHFSQPSPGEHVAHRNSGDHLSEHEHQLHPPARVNVETPASESRIPSVQPSPQLHPSGSPDREDRKVHADSRHDTSHHEAPSHIPVVPNEPSWRSPRETPSTAIQETTSSSYASDAAHQSSYSEPAPESGPLDISISRHSRPLTGDLTHGSSVDSSAVRHNQRTVLVVDDSPTVRKIVAVTLERQGYRVLAASGAIEAMARINEALPDLILLDIAMPHMDGYQLCKLIKGNTLTKSVPVVMLSGKDGFFDKVRGRMTGATHYITKPFEPTTLVDAVEKYCRRNGAN